MWRRIYSPYLNKYGAERQLKQFLSWGYDAVKILYSAWEKSKMQSGKALADAVRMTKELEVSTGKVSVNEQGSAPKYRGVWQVKDGKFVIVD